VSVLGGRSGKPALQGTGSLQLSVLVLGSKLL
jgi:hypothetical protein